MQRGEYSGGRPAPVPIFNHRKRQRQAVFADPGNISSCSAATPAPNQCNYVPDLMPLAGFQGGRQQADFQKKTVQSSSYTPAQKQKYNGPSSGHRGMSGPSATRTTAAPNSGNIQDNRSVSRNWGQQQNMASTSGVSYGNRASNQARKSSSDASTTQYSTNNQNQSLLQNQLQPRNNFNPQEQLFRNQNQLAGRPNNCNYSGGNNEQNIRSGFNNQPQTSMYGSSNININSQSANRGYTNSSNSLPQNKGYQGNANSSLQQNREYQGNTNNSLQQNRGYQDSNQSFSQNRGFGVNNQNSRQQNRGYSHDGKNFSNHPQPGGYGISGTTCSSGTDGSYRGWGGAAQMVSPLAAGMPLTPGGMFNKTAAAVSQGRKSSKQSEKKNKPQPSLRVLTANLSTVVNSAFLSEQLGPHMFEVFGILDSAVVTDRTGTGKEFVLRDETGTVQCVFYEIDRHLPRLIRGQWQRCVATLERKTSRLKCVSVRAARGEERHLARVGDETTQKLLTSLRRQASEQ